MHRRIMPLVIFMSVSLVAMNQQDGVWDVHGNYLGPSLQAVNAQPLRTSNPQMSMMPVLLMPIAVNPGESLPQPTFSYMPLPQNMMPYPFLPMQQPFYPTQSQTSVSSMSDQWPATPNSESAAVSTPLQGAEWVIGSDAAVETTRAPEVGEQDMLPKSPRPVVAPVAAQRNDDDDGDHDEEVAAITSSTEKMTLNDNAIDDDAHKVVAESKPAKPHWADDYGDDDDGPAMLPADWKPHAVQSEPVQPQPTILAASGATNSAPIKILKREQPAAQSAAREIQTAAMAAKQQAENRSYRDAARQVPPRFKHASDDVRNDNHARKPNDHALDQRLRAALFTHDKYNIISAIDYKISFLTKSCTASRMKEEAETTAQLLEQYNTPLHFSDKQARHLLDAAGHCLRVSQNAYQAQQPGRIGFARIARRLATLAQASLGDDEKARAQQLCEQAEKIIDPQKKNPTSNHAGAAEGGQHSANSVKIATSENNQPAVPAVQHKRQRPGKKQRDAQAASFMTLDEKIEDALQKSDTNRAVILIGNKTNALQQHAHTKKAADQCDEFCVLLDTHLGHKSQSLTPEFTVKLLQQARFCMNVTEKDTCCAEGKVGFARVAKKIIALIESALPAEHVSAACDLNEHANALLGSLNRSQDQTHAPAEEFYAGYQEGESDTHVRSDGKVLYGIVADDAEFSDAVSEDEDSQVEVKKKEATSQSKASPSTGRAQKKKEKKLSRSQNEQIEQEKGTVPSIDERLAELHRKGDMRETLRFWEQVAEGQSPYNDPEVLSDAQRTMSYYYVFGCANEQGTLLDRDLARAEHFINKAAESGDIHVLVDKVHLLFDPAKRAALYAHLDHLDAMLQSANGQTNDAGTFYSNDKTRCLLRVCRAAAHFMDNEKEQFNGEARTVFKEVHDHFSFHTSMGEVANALPMEFYEWVCPRLVGLYEQLRDNANLQGFAVIKTNQESGQESVDKDNVDCYVASKDAALDWLYFMGRLYVEGDSRRFGHAHYLANEWIKVAADRGQKQAQLFLAVPGSDPEDALPEHERIRYLEKALCVGGHSRPDAIRINELCNHYAKQGILKPIVYSLAALVINNDETNSTRLADYLKKMEDAHLPALRIMGDHRAVCKVAETRGLLKALEANTQTSWMARMLLSAIDIAGSRHREEKNREAETRRLIARVEQAIKRIEGDVKAHPEVESLVILGECVLGLLRSDLNLFEKRSEAETKEAAKKCRLAFERSIARGDDYAKQAYGYLLLEAKSWAQLAGLNDNEAEKRGIQLLEELAAQKESEPQSWALKNLAQHCIKTKALARAEQYLQRAKAVAQDLHNHEGYDELEKIHKSLMQERNELRTRMKNFQPPVNPKHIQSIQLVKQAATPASASPVKEPTQDDPLARLKRADSCIVDAAHQEKPLQAFALLKKAKELSATVPSGLAANANMLVLFCMALENVQSNAQTLPQDAKAQLEQELVPLIEYVRGATDSYLAGAAGAVDPVALIYLNAYTYLVSMRRIRALPTVAEDQSLLAKALLERISKVPGMHVIQEQESINGLFAQLPAPEFVEWVESALADTLATAREQYKKIDPTLGRGVARIIKVPRMVENRDEQQALKGLEQFGEEGLDTLRRADSCIATAVNEPLPLKALIQLKIAQELSAKVPCGLSANPHMLVLFCMAIERMMSAPQGSATPELYAKLQSTLEQAVIPLRAHAAEAIDVLFDGSLGAVAIDPLTRRYLDCYIHKANMRGMKCLPIEQQCKMARDLVASIRKDSTGQHEVYAALDRVTENMSPQDFVATVELMINACFVALTEKYKNDPTLGFNAERIIKVPLLMVKDDKKDTE